MIIIGSKSIETFWNFLRYTGLFMIVLKIQERAEYRVSCYDLEDIMCVAVFVSSPGLLVLRLRSETDENMSRSQVVPGRRWH